jgi:hypothetical protein
MPILDLRAVIYIHMVAMKAPADDVAEFGFGATAFATGPLLPSPDERRVGLGRHSLRNASLLLGCVLGAGAKLDWAIGVVVPLHGKTAAAFAIFATLPVMPSPIAPVMMAHNRTSL